MTVARYERFIIVTRDTLQELIRISESLALHHEAPESDSGMLYSGVVELERELAERCAHYEYVKRRRPPWVQEGVDSSAEGKGVG